MGPARDPEAPVRPQPAEATLPGALLDCSPPWSIRSRRSARRSRTRLAPHFTNLDRPVFALVELPETVKGALFARYSRYQGTLRRLYLDEFADDVAPAAPPRSRARASARRSSTSGSSSATATTRSPSSAARTSPASGSRTCSRRSSSARGSPSYLEQSTRYIAYDAAMPGGGYRYWRHPELGPEYEAAMDEPVRHLRAQPPGGRGLGRRPLPARRHRAGVRLPPLDQGEGARPAARPPPRRLAVAHGHLRQRPGLRAARAAPDGVAAAGGARLRLDDPARSSTR